MNNRAYSRHTVNDFTVDISDGKGCFSGSVHDISRFGVGIDDISTRLDNCADKYSVVIFTGKKAFKFTAFPRWAQEEGSVQRIGLQINNVPWEWTSFVMQFEEEPADVWGHAR